MSPNERRGPGGTPLLFPFQIMRHILCSTLFLSAALLGSLFRAQSAKASPECNSFNYGIGHCVNEGQFRSYPSRNSDGGYGNGYHPLLLDQPRSRPNSGQGYGYPSNGYRQGW